MTKHGICVCMCVDAVVVVVVCVCEGICCRYRSISLLRVESRRKSRRATATGNAGKRENTKLLVVKTKTIKIQCQYICRSFVRILSFLFFLFRVSVVISFQSSASGCGDRSPGERGSHEATDTILLPPPSPHYTLSPFSSPPLAGNHNH